jgi:hypothetical protein
MTMFLLVHTQEGDIWRRWRPFGGASAYAKAATARFQLPLSYGHALNPMLSWFCKAAALLY